MATRLTVLLAILAISVGSILAQSDKASTTTTTAGSDKTTSTTTTTTTTPPPTTTPAPPPTPARRPDDVPAVYVDIPYAKDENKSCVRGELHVLFQVSWDGLSGYEPLPPIKNITKGVCVDNTTASFSMVFGEPKHNETILKMTLTQVNGSIYASSVDLSLYVTPDVFPDGSPDSGKTLILSNSSLELFKTSENEYYHCGRDVTLDMGSNVTLIFTSIALEAFSLSEKTGYSGSVVECDSSSSKDVVPIAVGAALAALIVIVFIGYFVARKRSRRTAYQSV